MQKTVQKLIMIEKSIHVQELLAETKYPSKMLCKIINKNISCGQTNSVLNKCIVKDSQAKIIMNSEDLANEVPLNKMFNYG